MKIAIIFAVFLLGPGAALADDSKAPASKITLQECQNVRQGLRMLDGYQGVDKDGKSSPQQYKLGALRGPLALDSMDLDAVIKAGEQARLNLIKEDLPNGAPDPITDRKAYVEFMAKDAGGRKFTTDYQDLLDSPQPVIIPHIKLEQLKIGDPPEGNPIPSDALTLLEPILER